MTTRTDIADYIGSMAIELAKLARAEGLTAIAAMLEMAASEACPHMSPIEPKRAIANTH